MCFSNCDLKNGKIAAKASLFLFLAQILSVTAVKQSVIPHFFSHRSNDNLNDTAIFNFSFSIFNFFDTLPRPVPACRNGALQTVKEPFLYNEMKSRVELKIES